MLHFVPQSGPFARGIHATVFAQCAGGAAESEAVDAFKKFYADSSFVHISSSPPRLKDIVGTNNAMLSVSTDENSIAVCCVLDNLVKGASGGAVQCANIALGLDETAGLPTSGLMP